MQLKLLLLFGSIAYFALSIAAGIGVHNDLHHIFAHAVIVFGIIAVFRHLFLLTCALIDSKSAFTGNVTQQAKISIIVPAYNEALVIRQSLESLISVKYPDFEIIVVDDGSTDGTAEIARQFMKNHEQYPFQLIRQSNAGKATALNTGIKHASGEYVMCVDADSRLHPDALSNGVRHFVDEKVGAVGGFIEVINQEKLLTKFQQIEYLLSLNFLRAGLSLLGVVTVVPGPVGLFRKNALLEAGGYREDRNNFAEDADVTVRLLSLAWRVKGERSMLAFTEAPDTLYDLLRQRYRWKRGIYQAFHENIFSLTTSPDPRGPLIVFFLALEAFAIDIINFGITLFFLASVLAHGELALFIAWFALLIFLDILTVLFVIPERKKALQMMALFFLQKFTYAYLLQAWSVFSYLDEWRSTGMNWDKLERIGTH